jgi:DNA modification methylase
MPNLTILQGDALEQLRTIPDGSVQVCVTSPPYYGLRSYLKSDDPLKASEIGAEQTPQQYVDRMVEVFREVRRVLREDGVLWLNLGDSYGGSSGVHAGGSDKARSNTGAVNATLPSKGGRAKDLLMIPERVALALQADGWYLRAKCPWIKRNAMPESAKDRPTTVVEIIFMLTKSERYHYDAEAVKVAATCDRMRGPAEHADMVSTNGNGGLSRRKPRATRSRRSSDWFLESWQGLLQDDEGDPLAFVINPVSYRGAHFACFPPKLVQPCIEASTSAHGACPECGAPFQRVLVREPSDWAARKAMGEPTRHGLAGAAAVGAGNFQGETATTTGWKPTCDHTHTHTMPCVVLDPFGGSGTTAQVALALGMRPTVIELNSDYIPLIKQRCGVA